MTDNILVGLLRRVLGRVRDQVDALEANGRLEEEVTKALGDMQDLPARSGGGGGAGRL